MGGDGHGLKVSSCQTTACLGFRAYALDAKDVGRKSYIGISAAPKRTKGPSQGPILGTLDWRQGW